jgi:hypothetical protein
VKGERKSQNKNHQEIDTEISIEGLNNEPSININNPQLTPNDRIELLKVCALPSETITEHRARLIRENVGLIGKTGEPIFTKEDIHATNDFLAKIVRMYFVDQNITYEYLKIMHQIYCESICMLSNSINHDRNNFKRALLKPTMTKPFFEKVFNVLGVHIVDVCVTLLTENKQQLVYRINNNGERIE